MMQGELATQPQPAGPSTSAVGGEINDMMSFLYDVLHKLESAQGCIDDEARQGLELLRQKTQELEAAKARAATGPPAVSAQPPTSLDIAHKIQELQSGLNSLESDLGRLDSTAQRLVAHSTGLWLGEEAGAQAVPQQPGPGTL